MKQTADRIERKNLVLLGAAVAALISIAHSLSFRLDVWSPAALMSWYGLSLLVGSASGFVISRLPGQNPLRLHRMIFVGVVALLSLMGYLLQVSVFLSIVFRMVVWE